MEREGTHHDRPDVGDEFLLLFHLSEKDRESLEAEGLVCPQHLTAGVFANNMLEKRQDSSLPRQCLCFIQLNRQ